MAETNAFRCPLDKARNVGKHKLPLANGDNPKLGNQCRERIVRNFRFRTACDAEKGGLSGIGKPDQPNIGDQLQPQPDPAFFSRPAGFEFTRGTIGRCLEGGVAAPTVPALAERHALANFRKIRDQRFVIILENLRADGNLEDNIRRCGAGPVLPHAMAAAFCLEMLLIAIIDQGIEAFNTFNNDAAAPPAIAAIRAAELNEFFTPEAQRTGAAVAGTKIYFCLIEKLHGCRLLPCRVTSVI